MEKWLLSVPTRKVQIKDTHTHTHIYIYICIYVNTPQKKNKVNMLKHQAYAGSTSVFDYIRTTVPAAVLTRMAAEKQPHSTQKCVNGN